MSDNQTTALWWSWERISGNRWRVIRRNVNPYAMVCNYAQLYRSA